jgi:hypothetical protein
MNLWVIILFAILIIFTGVMYFLPNFANKTVSAQMTGPIFLNESTNLVSTTDSKFYLKAPQSTVQFFVYLSPMQRTPVTHVCGDAPGQSSCSNGRFPVCQCAGTDCSVCAHEGYYQLLNLFGAVQLEISSLPDAGRQSQASVQLLVRTQTSIVLDGTPVDSTGTGMTPQNMIETLALPPIPYQKWTMITISREGRRFDIYYDNNLVVSHIMLYTVTTTAFDTRGPMAGDVNVLGQLGLFNMLPFMSTSATVSAAYSAQSDTRGRPFLNALDETSTLFPKMSLGGIGWPSLPDFSLCPSGSCMKTPTVRPAQPWQDWDSNYS